MLGWALTFLILALASGLLGFTGIAAASVWIAQVLFVLFLGLLAVTLLMRVLRR